MRQASINLYNNDMEVGRIVLRAMLFVLACLAFAYTLILPRLVWNIVERRNLEREIQTLATDVGNLELEYLSRIGDIDVNLSRAMGFKETQANFATTSKAVGSLGTIGKESNEI